MNGKALIVKVRELNKEYDEAMAQMDYDRAERIFEEKLSVMMKVTEDGSLDFVEI